jgi:hypothetical protein
VARPPTTSRSFWTSRRPPLTRASDGVAHGSRTRANHKRALRRTVDQD